MAATPALSSESLPLGELTVNGRAQPFKSRLTGHLNSGDEAGRPCLLIAAYTSVYRIPLNDVPFPVPF